MEEVRKYLSQIGAKGGAAKSERKAQSCRENGKKGGRRKRVPLEPEVKPEQK